MNSIDEFKVEVRRDGLFLSSPGYFGTLFDATRAALDLAERLGRGAPGAPLHVVISDDAEVLLDIKVVPGTRLDA